ncbi:MAG: VCBS repeat-containing protein [Cytophagia bacterium]|nr:VCBS repeat-containing protein [Cytophagia bacterium]
MRIVKRLFVGLIFLMGIAEISLISCTKKNEQGEALAKKYCASCHLLPSPSLLPKNVWQLSTLPYMGILMGIKDEIANLPGPLKDYAILRPSFQMISKEEYEKIKAYYIEQAPKSLAEPNYTPLKEIKGLFSVEDVSLEIPNGTFPNMTNVSIDEESQQIMAGDQSNRIIWQLDSKGKPLLKIYNQNALTHVEKTREARNQFYFTYIGTTTQANPDVNGYTNLVQLAKGKFQIKQNLMKGLNRPIYLSAKNLDEEANDELIISEFGFKEGGLSVWKKDAKGNFQKKILNDQTGASCTLVRDFNQDGRIDIASLFAQGNERVILYLNQGKLRFKEQVLQRFPSIYGTSSFDLVDMDGDGDLDLICTAGDNADFSTILKPYHGIYIYQNIGNFNFKPWQFYPQNGATKAISADFDGDGDQDIASIALFPDVAKRSQEGFMYIEHVGKTFVQKTLPIQHLGRWSVMDAGDIDGDGDIDLVLGSHAVAKFPAGGFDPAWKQAKGLLILRNRLK